MIRNHPIGNLQNTLDILYIHYWDNKEKIPGFSITFKDIPDCLSHAWNKNPNAKRGKHLFDQYASFIMDNEIDHPASCWIDAAFTFVGIDNHMNYKCYCGIIPEHTVSFRFKQEPMSYLKIGLCCLKFINRTRFDECNFVLLPYEVGDTSKGVSLRKRIFEMDYDQYETFFVFEDYEINRQHWPKQYMECVLSIHKRVSQLRLGKLYCEMIHLTVSQLYLLISRLYALGNTFLPRDKDHVCLQWYKNNVDDKFNKQLKYTRDRVSQIFLSEEIMSGWREEESELVNWNENEYVLKDRVKYMEMRNDQFEKLIIDIKEEIKNIMESYRKEQTIFVKSKLEPIHVIEYFSDKIPRVECDYSEKTPIVKSTKIINNKKNKIIPSSTFVRAVKEYSILRSPEDDESDYTKKSIDDNFQPFDINNNNSIKKTIKPIIISDDEDDEIENFIAEPRIHIPPVKPLEISTTPAPENIKNKQAYERMKLFRLSLQNKSKKEDTEKRLENEFVKEDKKKSKKTTKRKNKKSKKERLEDDYAMECDDEEDNGDEEPEDSEVILEDEALSQDEEPRSSDKEFIETSEDEEELDPKQKKKQRTLFEFIKS